MPGPDAPSARLENLEGEETVYLLLLDIAGAAPHEIQRGLTAARAVFDRAGISPREGDEARAAHWERGSRLRSRREAAESRARYEVWTTAERAAIDACCAGWQAERRPTTIVMDLIGMGPPAVRTASGPE